MIRSKSRVRWLPATCILLLAGARPNRAADPSPGRRRRSSPSAAGSVARSQIDSPALGCDAAVEYLLSGQVPASRSCCRELPEFKGTPVTPTANSTRRSSTSSSSARAHGFDAYRGYWLDRMLRSDRPLEEKMTLFWHGLLCSGIQEVKSGRS